MSQRPIPPTHHGKVGTVGEGLPRTVHSVLPATVQLSSKVDFLSSIVQNTGIV